MEGNLWPTWAYPNDCSPAEDLSLTHLSFPILFDLILFKIIVVNGKGRCRGQAVMELMARVIWASVTLMKVCLLGCKNASLLLEVWGSNCGDLERTDQVRTLSPIGCRYMGYMIMQLLVPLWRSLFESALYSCHTGYLSFPSLEHAWLST